MQQFDINQLIAKNNLDTSELAKVLFPNVKYPKQALDRVLKNEAHLDVEQLHYLAKHLGVLVSDLFTIDMWHSGYIDGHLTFTKDNYKVVINMNGCFLTLFKDNTVVEQIVHSNEMLQLKQFINSINNLISRYNDRDFSKSSD